MARSGGGDPYFYPGTDVLRNKLGIRDNATLRLAEYAYSRVRSRDVPTFPMTAKGYLATHQHLFQDLYDWAGVPRTVTLGKGESAFAFPHAIEASMEKRFMDLAAKGGLRGLSREAFATGAAHHISELNAIHPFREGNGRTMRLHLQQLAAQAGFRLEPVRLPAQGWIEASIVAFRDVNEAPLAGLILDAITSARQPDKGDPTTAVPEAYRQLSPNGRLAYAAWAEKIGREMTKLTPESKTAMREMVARDLLRREEREGPVVLSSEQRRLATTPEPPPDRGEQTTPAQPEPSGPGKRRR